MNLPENLVTLLRRVYRRSTRQGRADLLPLVAATLVPAAGSGLDGDAGVVCLASRHLSVVLSPRSIPFGPDLAAALPRDAGPGLS